MVIRIVPWGNFAAARGPLALGGFSASLSFGVSAASHGMRERMKRAMSPEQTSLNSEGTLAGSPAGTTFIVFARPNSSVRQIAHVLLWRTSRSALYLSCSANRVFRGPERRAFAAGDDDGQTAFGRRLAPLMAAIF